MTNLSDTLAALSEAIELQDCPPGLFWFEGTLGFKSEYTTTLENPRRYQCDAYVVESGEYFHGGAKGTAERAKLLVHPICTGQLVPVPSVERIARVIADQLGDDYSMVPKNKGEWLRARGMCGGFPRDINMPFRSDYDAAATAIIAAMQEGRDG